MTDEQIPEPDGGDDDSNYYLGVFYFNPRDKRIFPPKRAPGIGWTINFANPISVVALIFVMVLPYLLIRLIN